MNEVQLTPVAEMLIAGYFETATFSRQFRDSYGQPPTAMCKAHHHRSLVQSSLANSDGYELHSAYAEFGRVQFLDRLDGRTYCLRSHGAITIERKRRQAETLFDSTEMIASPVTLLVYEFGPGELRLSMAGSRQTRGRGRLLPTGAPVFVASWPYEGAGTIQSFDQGMPVNPFEEVGDLDVDGLEGQGA